MSKEIEATFAELKRLEKIIDITLWVLAVSIVAGTMARIYQIFLTAK